MPIRSSYLDNDVAAVEEHEGNLDSVVDVKLPDNVSIVTAIRRGESLSLGMELTGFSDKRRDEIWIRKAELDRVLQPVPEARQTLTITARSWLIESVDSPDGVVYRLQLVQNW